MASWLSTSLTAAAMVVVSAVGIYVGVLMLTRLVGLRSFAKISGFDFAMTVAIGSLVASTVIARDPPLLQAAVGLVSLYGLQFLVSVLRRRTEWAQLLVDNEPLLLMEGQRILRENLRRAQLTEDDLLEKLREANVLRMEQVRAVVMETTGDVTVLHGAPGGPELEPDLLRGVKRESRRPAA